MTAIWRHAALLLPLVALLELAGHCYFAHRGPRLTDYGALSRPVTALRQPGDLVVIAPRWAEPMARQSLGTELMPLAAVARPDEESFTHAVEIAVHGAAAPELAGWRELARAELGPFTIRRLENPAPAPALSDFVEALAPATAAVTLGSGPCMWNPRARVEANGLGGHPTWPRARFDCGLPHLFAGVTVIEDEASRPRRCIWAHPPPEGELVIRFPRARLGTRIVGHGAMSWHTERARAGAPVELAVRVDGALLGRFIHTDGEGWARFEWPTPDRAGSDAEVTFAVSAPDDEDRGFCFEARAL